MNYLKLAKSKELDLINTLSKWIKSKGLEDYTTAQENAPFGKEVYDALEFMANLGEKDGFIVDRCNGYCTEIEYGSGLEMIMAVGHADVVPVGNGWSRDPYSGEIDDQFVYGRGSNDDKGPTLAAYYALKIIQEEKIPVKRRIKLVVGGNEETGSKCMRQYFQVQKREHPVYAFTPDAAFPVIYGEKGITNFIYQGPFQDELIESIIGGVAANSVPDTCVITLKKKVILTKEVEEFQKNHPIEILLNEKENKTIITLKGKAAHGSTPQLGTNAGIYALQFAGKYLSNETLKYYGEKFNGLFGEDLGISCDSKEMGKLTVCVGLLRIENFRYQFTLNIRFPLETNPEIMIQTLKECALHEFVSKGYEKPLYIDKNSAFIQTLIQSYQEISGDTQTLPYTIGGGTYAKSVPNCVAFGCQFPDHLNRGTKGLHSNDECISREELVEATAIYLKAFIDLGNLSCD